MVTNFATYPRNPPSPPSPCSTNISALLATGYLQGWDNEISIAFFAWLIFNSEGWCLKMKATARSQKALDIKRHLKDIYRLDYFAQSHFAPRSWSLSNTDKTYIDVHIKVKMKLSTVSIHFGLYIQTSHIYLYYGKTRCEGMFEYCDQRHYLSTWQINFEFHKYVVVMVIE